MEREHIMDSGTSPQEDWKHNPWIVGGLVVLFFPYGLYLLWKHPTWTSRAKWTSTVAYFVCVIIGSLGESKTGNPQNQSTSQAEPAVSATSPADPETLKKEGKVNAKGQHQIGEEFQLGDYKYKCLAANSLNQIGNQFVTERPSPGAVFVVVTYTIENCSNESQTIWNEDFSLIDSQGRKFNASSDANTALVMVSDDQDFLVSELQPGIPRTMQQAFEVPQQVLEADLTLIVPKKGSWVGGEAKVTIRVR